ncbi:nucleotidyltransferase domain-containing protein [Candidatus Woesearchaeota archaeon]|nr:nucleotidyltransferase domain-containing protein [Candidatus Woesearchaeota archaeon]
MLGKNEILKRLKENKITIKGFGVKRLFLIGSYAKGREKNDSDIDL